VRKIKEVLRLKFEVGLGLRQIARSCSIGLGTAHEYLERADAAKITWPLGAEWDDDRLEAALFGSLRNLLARVSRIDVLVIDDWAMAPLSEPERRDFWEICEDRYQVRSTILTSQLPVARWHEQIGEPALADGILDRLVHNAHRIEMRGDSMRKNRGKASASSNGD
jgi:hypothetical protein